MKTPAIAHLVVSFAAATAAQADWTLLEDLRHTTSWAESWSNGHQSYDAPDTATHDFGDPGLIITGGFSSWQGAIASSQAYEDSTFWLERGRLESRGHAIGHVTTNDSPTDGQIARTESVAHFEMLFELHSPAMASYDAWATGGATVQMVDSTGAVIFEGDATVEQFLAAGQYRIIAEAPLFLESIEDGASTFGGSDYWFSIVVPAPGTGAAVLFGAWMFRRRRD